MSLMTRMVYCASLERAGNAPERLSLPPQHGNVGRLQLYQFPQHGNAHRLQLYNPLRRENNHCLQLYYTLRRVNFCQPERQPCDSAKNFQKIRGRFWLQLGLSLIHI